MQTIKCYANGLEFDFNLERVPADRRDAVLAYLVSYGLNQCGQDAGAGETREAHEGDAEKAKAARQAKARARWEALLKGDVPTGGGFRTADPEASAMRALLLTFRSKAAKPYKAEDVPLVKDGMKMLLAFATKHHKPAVIAALKAAMAVK
jgi:hypothetical protein